MKFRVRKWPMTAADIAPSELDRAVARTSDRINS